MDVLIRLIREEFEGAYAATPPQEEVENFVRRAFAARNIVPSPELVRQVVDHLAKGTPVGHLTSGTLRHCGQ